MPPTLTSTCKTDYHKPRWHVGQHSFSGGISFSVIFPINYLLVIAFDNWLPESLRTMKNISFWKTLNQKPFEMCVNVYAFSDVSNYFQSTLLPKCKTSSWFNSLQCLMACVYFVCNLKVEVSACSFIWEESTHHKSLHILWKALLVSS